MAETTSQASRPLMHTEWRLMYLRITMPPEMWGIVNPERHVNCFTV